MPTDVNHEELPTKSEMEAVVNDEFDGLEGAVDIDSPEGTDDTVRVGDVRGERTEEPDEQLDEEGGDDLLEPAPQPGRPRPRQETLDDTERPRDDRGRFAKDGQPGQPVAGQAPGAPGAAAAGAAAPAAAPSAGQVKWEPLSVAVDKAIFPIEHASVGKIGEHRVVSVPEAKWPEFQSRLTKGVVAERRWRELQDHRTQFDQAVQQFRMDRDGPQPKTDAEIEAEQILEWLKPKLPDLFDDPREKAWLGDRIKAAQLAYKDQFANERRSWVDQRRAEEAARPNPQAEEQYRVNGLTDVMRQIATAYPQEFPGLTPALARQMADEVMQVRRAAFYRDVDQQGQPGWFADSRLIFSRMKAVMDRHRQSGTPAPANAGTTGPGQGTPAPKDARQAADERFNKGQGGVAAPPTTNLKQRRTDPRQAGTTGKQPPKASTPGTSRHDQAIAAEDVWRRAGRNYLNSPGLDFEDEG